MPKQSVNLGNLFTHNQVSDSVTMAAEKFPLWTYFCIEWYNFPHLYLWKTSETMEPLWVLFDSLHLDQFNCLPFQNDRQLTKTARDADFDQSLGDILFRQFLLPLIFLQNFSISRSIWCHLFSIRERYSCFWQSISNLIFFVPL